MNLILRDLSTTSDFGRDDNFVFLALFVYSQTIRKFVDPVAFVEL